MQPHVEVLVDQITCCEVLKENACFFGEGENRYCLDVDTLYRHMWNKKSQEPCSLYLQKLEDSLKEKVLEYKKRKDVIIFVSLSKYSYPLIAPYYRNVGDHIIAIVRMVELMGRERNSKKESYSLHNLLKYDIRKQNKSLYSNDLTKPFNESWFSKSKSFKISFTSISDIMQQNNARKLINFVNQEPETSEYYEIKFQCHAILGLDIQLDNDTSSSEEPAFVHEGNENYYIGVAIANYLYAQSPDAIAFAPTRPGLPKDLCQTRVASKLKGYNTHNSVVTSPYTSTVGEFYFEYINEFTDRFQPLLLLLHMPTNGQRLLKLNEMTRNNNQICIQHISTLLDSWMEELSLMLHNQQVPVNLTISVTTLTTCYTNIKSGVLGVFEIFPKEWLYKMLLDCAKNDMAHKMKTEDIEFSNITSQLVNEIICTLDGQARFSEIISNLFLRLFQMGYHITKTEECILMGIAYDGSWYNVFDNMLCCGRYKLVNNHSTERLAPITDTVVPKTVVPLKIYVETVTEDLLLNTSGELVVEENILTTVHMLNSKLFDPEITKQRKKALCNVLVSRNDIDSLKKEFLNCIVTTLPLVRLSKLCNILSECEMTELNMYFLTELSKVYRA